MTGTWVVIFYVAIIVWVGLLIFGLKTRKFRPFLGMGIALALLLNIGYFVNGQADSIAFFVSIYDVADNIGLGNPEAADALATCPNNECSVWGDRYVNHPSWGVAFYDRFANGSAIRANMLYIHIFFNSVSFVLMHYLLFRPGFGADKKRHKMVGKVSFGFLTAGTIAALWMASEHASVNEYGGIMSQLGFYSMSFFVYGTAVMGIRKIRSGDHQSHRIWMIRHAGAMWGAFWLFRVMLVFTGPIFRGTEAVSLLLSIWLSAPLGIIIAEAARRRFMLPSGPSETKENAPAFA